MGSTSEEVEAAYQLGKKYYHEFAHAERFQMGYRRPTDLPDVLLDEAETSLRASFTSLLSQRIAKIWSKMHETA
jgi:hypothetical protein